MTSYSQYPPQGYDYQSPPHPPPSQYGSPPPAQYDSPPYQPPADKPPIPREWRPFYDPHHQRWYYANETTHETQWEAPGYYSPAPPGGEYRGYDQNQQQQQQYGGGEPTKGSGGGGGGGAMGAVGGAMLGAASGLALSAGSSYLMHGIQDHFKGSDSSDDEHRRVTETVYVEQQQAPPPMPPPDAGYVPGVLPSHDADGNSVSSSDREEVEEARERYEEALRDADSSSASSSDREEVEEARQEYEEAYEETYGGDDDYCDDYNDDDY